ncbi:Transcription termination factor 2 [Dirofilaria immitis]|nr:Transcription termination factor 2 [Dirofilaria immitis]
MAEEYLFEEAGKCILLYFRRNLSPPSSHPPPPSPQQSNKRHVGKEMLLNDDMTMRKIEQQAKHESFPPSVNTSLDLMSPIGKIRQRELGPTTSTPVGFPDEIFQNSALTSDAKGLLAKSSSSNDISNNREKTFNRIKEMIEVAVFLVVWLNVFLNNALHLLNSRKREKHGQLTALANDLHEVFLESLVFLMKIILKKTKITWGCAVQTADILEIATLKASCTGDKVLASQMQVSAIEQTNNMDISKRSSTNGEADLYKKNKNPQFTISLEDEVISDNSCLSFLDEKANISMLNEIEDVTVSSSLNEDCVHISSANSSNEGSNNIEKCVLITANKFAATSINDASENDIQIIGHFSPSHSSSITGPAEKIPATLSRIELERQLNNLKNLKRSANLSKLPDFGQRLLDKVKILQRRLNSLDVFEKDKSGTSNGLISINMLETKKLVLLRKKELPIISPQTMDRGRRLFGGKMTNNRICLANAVTGQVIAQMHSSLANVPENVKTDTPLSLITELMPHQKKALPGCCGVRDKLSLVVFLVPDDMGLGKTLSMISLIVNVKERRKQNAELTDGLNKRDTKNSCLIPSRATLIVAPASLIFQWEAEFQKHVKNDFLSRYLFHGPKHKRDIDAKCLARYDVVITTYGVVSSELTEKFTKADIESEGVMMILSGSALTKIDWERIILDEAHHIKNKTSLISKACCKIPAATRWCLTGTPIHNNLWDLYSLIRFLRVVPFDEEAVWKEYILSALLFGDDIMIDNNIKPVLVDLKSRMYEKIVMKLEGIEKKVYDYMFQISRQQVKELIKKREERVQDLCGIGWTNANNKPARSRFSGDLQAIRKNNNFQTMTCVLTLLMRLRQACVHLALINQVIDMEALQTLGVEKNEDAEMLSKYFSNLSLLDEKAFSAKLQLSDGNEQIEQLFQKTFLSTKIIDFSRYR